MAVYAYDLNAILVQPMKNKSTTEIIVKFTILHDRLCNTGIKPLYQKIDNEAPAAFKKCTQNTDIYYHLVSPHIHIRNPTERAIRTFKNHFIVGHSSTDPDFPMQAWYRLISQAKMTLTMLRPFRLNLKNSAYAQLHGDVNYNKTPLTPQKPRF